MKATELMIGDWVAQKHSGLLTSGKYRTMRDAGSWR